MKYYVADMNGILADLKKKIGPSHLATPRDADVWIVWQDVLGSYGDLIRTAKQYYNKPVYVVQHGRAATLDYGPPNSFPLLADKYLCWGKADYERMSGLGYGERTEIVGCPLNSHILPKVPHSEKIVLFVPVNTGKEEPENIAAYYELLKHKYHKAQVKVLESKDSLKDRWSMENKLNVSFNDISKDFDVVAKLLPWHDKNLYHGNTLIGYQHSPTNNELVFNLLRNVDLVVGIDEGCTEIYAYGHNVPVVIVDGFQYRQYGRTDSKFTLMDIYRTKAGTHIPLCDLQSTLDAELANPSRLEKERAEVAEAELGISYGDANDNILRIIKRDMKKGLYVGTKA
jgi:hypothetical protein